MKLEDISPDALPELIEDLTDLRHDLGKYITFEVRFLGPDPDTESLRAALRADILQTAKRGEQISSAWEVWAGLRPAALAEDPDVARIEAALAGLRHVDLAGDQDTLQQAADLARQVAEGTRSLHRRAVALEEQE